MIFHSYVSLPQGTNYCILHSHNLAFVVKLLRPNLSTAAGCTPHQRPGACDSGSGILEQPGIAGPLPLEGSEKVVLVVPDGHATEPIHWRYLKNWPYVVQYLHLKVLKFDYWWVAEMILMCQCVDCFGISRVGHVIHCHTWGMSFFLEGGGVYTI